MTEKDLTDGPRRLDSPAAREREKATRDLIRKIYGDYLGLRALGKVPQSKTVDDLIGTISASLHQKLVDYLLGKKNRTLVSLGMIGLISYKYKMSSDPKEPPASERIHALSRNKIMFLFPSPIENEPPFTVRTRLSDLRRPGVLANSLEALKLLRLRPRDILPESRDDFVSRTVDELVSVESARNRIRAAEPGSPRIAYLRDQAEYLVAGRLLALNQLEPVPGLGLAVTRNGDRISARIKFNSIVVTQNYPAQLFDRPAGNTEAFIKAGVLFSDEVA